MPRVISNACLESCDPFVMSAMAQGGDRGAWCVSNHYWFYFPACSRGTQGQEASTAPAFKGEFIGINRTISSRL